MFLLKQFHFSSKSVISFYKGCAAVCVCVCRGGCSHGLDKASPACCSSLSLPLSPPLSPLRPRGASSWAEVRYSISASPFLTVSNAHQVPRVGGLRALIGCNSLTSTQGPRVGNHIVSQTPGPPRSTSGAPLVHSWADGNVQRRKIQNKAPVACS